MQADWRSRIHRVLGTPSREAVLVALGVALAYGLLQLSTPRIIGEFHDDAVYVALGKALATGHGFHSIYAAGEPVHQKYPPGLPLLFAGLWLVGGSLPAVTWLAGTLSVLVSATAAGLVWWIARARLGLHPLIAFVCAIGPFLLDGAVLYLSLPISEPYFMLGWGVCLILASPLADRLTLARAAALGAVAAATTLVRTEGVAAIAGLLLALLLQRVGWRRVTAFLAAAVTPLFLWTALHARLVAAGPVSTQPDELPYGAWLAVHSAGGAVHMAAATLRDNWPAYWNLAAPYISEVKVASLLVLAICLVLAAAGAALAASRHPALPATLLASVVVVLLWPWPQDRFLFSRLPFAGLLMGAAVQAGVERAAPELRRLALVALTLFGAGVAARQATLRQLAYLPASTQPILGIPYPGHFMVANARFVTVIAGWLREHTTPDDRVLVDAPAAIYLYTGRHAVAASPATPAIVPDVYTRPGNYLATRVVDDRVSVIVLTDPTRALARDIALFFRRCPGTLSYLGNLVWWGRSRAFFFRVSKPDGCIEAVSSEP